MSFESIMNSAVQSTENQVQSSDKPDLTGTPTMCGRLPRKVGESIEIAGCKITCTEEPSSRTIPNTGSIANFWQGEKTKATYGKYKCESEYLGDFEFDSAYFNVGYKTVTLENGATEQVPILRYQENGLENKATTFDWKMFNMDLGTMNVPGSAIKIPDGVKRLDWTFEDCDTVENLPGFPDSIVSADHAFVGCRNLNERVEEMMEILDDLIADASKIPQADTRYAALELLNQVNRDKVGLYIDAMGVDGAREEADEFWEYFDERLEQAKLESTTPVPVIDQHGNDLVEKNIGNTTITPQLPKKAGETVEIAGCKIRCIEDASPRKIPNTESVANFWQGEKTKATYGKYVCESAELGTFLFDSSQFTIGYRDVDYVNGVTGQKPVLKYVPGLEDRGQTMDWKFFNTTIISQNMGARTIEVPNGAKSIDFTFADCKDLPPIHVPDSVTSARGAFDNCDNDLRIDAPASVMEQAFKSVDSSHVWSMHEMFNDATGLKNDDKSEPTMSSGLVRETFVIGEADETYVDGLEV